MQITSTGTTIATTGASANVAIPTNTTAVQRYVRVAATQAAYVKLGVAGVTAAAGDALIQPGDSLVFACGGFTHIAAVQVTAAGIVHISPVDA